MAQRTIGPVTVVANVEKDSGAGALPSSVSNVLIQLVDSAGVWDTTPGNIKIWGVQQSHDNGVTWNWGPVFQGHLTDATQWIPFGTRNRKGELPALQVGSSAIVNSQGDQLRLGILTDAGIVLSASLTIS